MFNLFALVKDPDGAITNDTLIHDLERGFPFLAEYAVSKKDLIMPRTTIVVLAKQDWTIRLSIRDQENMSVTPAHVLKYARKRKTVFPDHFESYDTEIAIGFSADPEQEYTDDIIYMGEFIRENYPGVFIWDQYNRTSW